MPPRKAVPKLEDICSSNIANGLFSLIDVWEKTRSCWPWYRAHYCDGIRHHVGDETKPREVQEYIAKKLPVKLREEILEKTIDIISKSLKHVPKEYDDGVGFIGNINFYLKFALKFLLFKGITYLDLTPIAHLITKTEGVHYYENMFAPRDEIFTDSLDDSNLSLNTLKYLKLPHFVYDEFITLVAKRCTELEYLILSCSPDCLTPKHRWDNIPVGGTITDLYAFAEDADSDRDIEQYDSDDDMEEYYVDDEIIIKDNLDVSRSEMGCKKLKQLILPDKLADNIDSIDLHGHKFINCMKDLKYLEGIPMLHVAYFYGYLGWDVDLEGGSIRLSNFHHGAHNNFPGTMYWEPRSPCISQHFSFFKEITEVSIYAPVQETELVLKSFSHVQTVALATDQYEIHSSYLNNLVKLDINIGQQEEWPILNHISTSSPKLEHLIFRSFSLHVKVNDIILTSVKLPELKTLKLIGQTFIHSNSLYKCLSGCPSLTSLYISMMKNDGEELENVLDDSVMLSVVPLLSNLQKFSFKLQCTSPRERIIPWLTMTTLNALVEHCPQLNRIEQLDTWNISKENVANFYLKCKENNWDLDVN